MFMYFYFKIIIILRYHCLHIVKTKLNLKNNFKLSFFIKAYNFAAVIHFGRLQHLRRGYGAHGTCCAHSLWGCAP